MDEIIKMAREAGWSYMEIGMDEQRLENFARLVEDAAFARWAAQTKLAVDDEREACAKVCIASDLIDFPTRVEDAAINKCAEAIRARGQHG